MQNDKVFAVYTITLICGLAALLTFVLSAENAAIPTPLNFVEHVGLSLLFRAAYKGIGGFDASDWTVAFDTSDEVADEHVATPGAGAHA